MGISWMKQNGKRRRENAVKVLNRSDRFSVGVDGARFAFGAKHSLFLLPCAKIFPLRVQSFKTHVQRFTCVSAAVNARRSGYPKALWIFERLALSSTLASPKP